MLGFMYACVYMMGEWWIVYVCVRWRVIDGTSRECQKNQNKLFVGMASITDVRKKIKVWFPEWKNTFLNGQVERITVKSLTQWTDSQILRFVPVVSFCHAKN